MAHWPQLGVGAIVCHRDKVLLVNLSGRGDKDMATVARASGIEF